MVFVKREPNAAPSEKADKFGFAKGLDHYRHQIKLVNTVVNGPWTVCFGALGSGIIGVRPPREGDKVWNLPEKAKQLQKLKKEMGKEAKQEKMKLETVVKVEERREEDNDDDEGVALAEENVVDLPTAATIFLLINSKQFTKQARNGKALGDYPSDELDVATGQLRWSSQHMDRHNKKLDTIIGHCRRGGRVVVATRGNDTDRLCFKVLGDVQRISDIRRYQFLVQEDEMVVQERGSSLHHKAIKAECLDAGLRSGIGLVGVRYNEGSFCGRFCLKCSYMPGSAILHFSELQPGGVAAFLKKEEHMDVVKEDPSETVKKEPKRELPDGSAPSTKRFRYWSKLPGSARTPIKLELDEDLPSKALSGAS